ncbi:VOC family protein [Microbacterium sp.]|uniref:VOC family protein n=1 Tax=Microbacterium sp. TaxID=51671 RepID=UPI003A8A92EF
MPTHGERYGRAGALSFHHAGVVVADLDAAIAYHRDILGFEVDFLVRDMDDLFRRTVGLPGVVCDLAQLVAPYASTRIEVLQVRHLPDDVPGWMPVHVGVGHTAYQVDNIRASVAALCERGGRILGEIVEFEEGPAAYVVTPARTIIELEEAWT